MPWAAISTTLSYDGGAELLAVDGGRPDKLYTCLNRSSCYTVEFDVSGVDDLTEAALILESEADVAFSYLGDPDFAGLATRRYNFCLEDLCAFDQVPSAAPTVSPAPSGGPTLPPSASWPPSAAPTDYWDVCAGSDYDLEIEGSDILANNLGGAGPNFDDEPVLRYAEVTTKGGRAVDLVVSVQDGSEYAVADNYELYQGERQRPRVPRRVDPLIVFHFQASGSSSARSTCATTARRIWTSVFRGVRLGWARASWGDLVGLRRFCRR